METGWVAEAGAPALREGEVHVWRFPLRIPNAPLRLLDAEERERASRFRFAEHRDAFVAGRGIQRDLLSRYLRVEPAAIRYRLGAQGKPALHGEPARSGLRFNASNAAGMGLLAVALDRELGVDVEAIRPLPDGMDIAARFFSAAENEALRGVPPELCDLAFFRCWTLKEAYLKAHGGGLSVPLDCFDVAFAPGQEARLLRTRDDPAEAARWTMRALTPGDGYVGALAVEGGGWTLRQLDWRRDHADA